MSNSCNLSVLMPVYNAERYLCQSVESILNQTFTDFEFLIVDDGSKDNSLRILEGYARRDPRIRLISRPNTGYVIALNEMLALAQGEFIARMDADDISFPNRFAAQLAHLRANPQCVVVGSGVRYIDPDGRHLMNLQPPCSHDAIDHAHLSDEGPLIWHPAALMRRDAIASLAGYRIETTFSEDFDLWLRLAEIGELANLPQVHIAYRQHLSSVTATNAIQAAVARERALSDALERRGLPAVSRSNKIRVDPVRINTYQRWAWWALTAGNVRTARRYAIRACLANPFSMGNWRLAFCAVRGR